MKYYFLILIAVLFSQCSGKIVDERFLCQEFYNLNKEKSLEFFFDISIDCGRLTASYNKSTSKADLHINRICIFDSDSNRFMSMPIFQSGDSFSRKDSIFQKISDWNKLYLSKRYGIEEGDSVTIYYQRYVDSFNVYYSSLRMPKSLDYSNIVFKGNPRLGRFITFTLNKKSKVYYLEDRESLTDYWSKRFDNMQRLDEKWFYEIDSPPSR